MILNSRNAGKVLTDRYKRTLNEAYINKTRVSEEDYRWLEVPDSVGTGQYDPERHSWDQDTMSHDGGTVRMKLNKGGNLNGNDRRHA